MTNPEEPDGVNENFTDKDDKDLNSLKDSDPETTASTPLFPCLSPQEKNSTDMNPVKGGARTSPPSANPSTHPKETNNSDNKDKLNLWHLFNIEDKNICDKVTHDNLTDIFLKLLKKSPEESLHDNNDDLKRFLEIHKKHHLDVYMKNKDKQYAYAFIDEEGKIKVTEKYMPHQGKGKHSEDLLITEIEKYINEKHIKEIKNKLVIYIFTTNSPCYGRQKTEPCLSTILKFSTKHRNVKIVIVFSKYYVFVNQIHDFIQKNAGPSWYTQCKFCVKLDITEFVDKCKSFQLFSQYNNLNIINNYEGINNNLNIINNYEVINNNLYIINNYEECLQKKTELESTLREEMNDDFTPITKLLNDRWTRSVDQSLNRHILLPIFNWIQDHYHNVKFVQVDSEEMERLIPSYKQERAATPAT
ncbi:uncharacterized protein LOC128617455 [Ictalurus furcatus]|uniref:uncharacterized protein LOC128617455 n=1 Tax=Ictalurus furcatus TaxID=66913 RepID=UPI002350BD03|nr:uncharacterized protein LOC128617455 [Ictalurus furcatus]